MTSTNPVTASAEPATVSRDNLFQIGGRILAFRRLVHILKEKQDAGGKLAADDLVEFKVQVSQLIEEDMSVLMGVIQSLVAEGEEMLSLLHEVAAAKKDDFDTIQMKCLVFLSQVKFED